MLTDRPAPDDRLPRPTAEGAGRPADRAPSARVTAADLPAPHRLVDARARAARALQLLARGHGRPADGELRGAEPTLAAWAEAVPDADVQAEVALAACVRTLLDAELSVRTEPVCEHARLALHRCARALAAAPGPHLPMLAPWAWSSARAWLAVLDPPTPGAFAEVVDAWAPAMEAGVPSGEAWSVEGLVALAGQLRRIGPPVPGVVGRLVDALVVALHADGLPLGPVADGRQRPCTALAGPSVADADGTSWSEGLARLVTLPDTDAQRRRLAAGLVHVAARLQPPGRRRGPDARVQAAVARLHVAAARLWAAAGHWPTVLESLDQARGTPVAAGSDDHEAWREAVHLLATAPDADDARRRSRRRFAPLRRWVAQALPVPADPVDEARWFADLAAWDGAHGEALAWRRETLARIERSFGPGSLDRLYGLQALRDTLAAVDPDHPDLEGLHDEGTELALRLCGPMSAEHWWWRGMRALWWHAQGHPQALREAAAEAEAAVVQTVRSGDALACACMRELIAAARRVSPPAGTAGDGWAPRPGLQ